MNILLDWLVDRQKVANEKALKESSLTETSSRLVFVSEGTTLIIRKCFIVQATLTGLLIQNELEETCDSFIFTFDIHQPLQIDIYWLFENVTSTISIRRESLYKMILELRKDSSLYKFAFHRDQESLIFDFLNV